MNRANWTIESTVDELVLAEVALEAHQRFGHRKDEDQLVRSAIAVAQEILSRNPMVTDFIVEIALSSRETMHFHERYAA